MSFAELFAGPAQTDAPPVRAEVTPLVAYSTGDIADIRNPTPAQARIRKYDREGPGILGATLDIPAGLSTHVRLVVRRRTPTGWVVSDDPAANFILAMWKGRHESQSQLFRKLIRSLDGVGEVYQVREQDPADKSWYYELHSTSSIVAKPDGTAVLKLRPNARPNSRWQRTIDQRHVEHLYTADNEWPGLAWTPMHRALGHIEDYRKALRTVGRNLDSQLAMNGILWAKAVTGGSTWIDKVKSWTKAAIDDDSGIEAVSPFLLETVEKPEWLDVGRADHEDQLLAADKAVMAFAQSVDVPTKMVLEGPGAANHWNDIAIGDWLADFTMHPRLERAAQMVYTAHWRPWAKVLGLVEGNLDDYQIWFDDASIRGKTDRTPDIFKAWDRGIANAQAVADAIGLTPEQVLELPDAVAEFDAGRDERGVDDRADLPVLDGAGVPVDAGRAPAEMPDPDDRPVRAALGSGLIPSGR